MQNAQWAVGISQWHFRKDTQRAIARIARSAEIDPDSVNPPAFIALIALDVADVQTAERMLLQPGEAGFDSYWPTLARLAYGVYNGMEESALSAARVLASYSTEPMALRFLRDHALAEGRYEDAIAVYPESLRAAEPQLTSQNVRLAADLAFALDASGERERAVRLAEQVLDSTSTLPRNAWSGFWLADVTAESVLNGAEAGLERLNVALASGWHLMAWWELEHNAALSAIRALPAYSASIETLESRGKKLVPDEHRPGRTLAFCRRLD